MSTIHMKYGSFNFEPQPIPFMTLVKEYDKTPNGINIGTTIKVSLEGTLIKATGGLISTINDLDSEADTVRSAFNQDGLLFLVFCSGAAIAASMENIQTEGSLINITTENNRIIQTEGSLSSSSFEDVSTIFFSGYPRVNSLSFNRSSDNWVRTIPYNIELEFDTTEPTEDTSLMPPYLQDASESWSIEPVDEQFSFSWNLSDGRNDACPYKFRVSHEVGAVGKAAYDVGGLIKQPWEWAKQYVTGLLNYDHSMVTQQGVITFDISKFNEYNHNRNTVIDKTAGSFTTRESWLVVETGVGTSGLPGNALETFNIDVNKGIDNGLTTAVINGEIRGLADVSMTGTDITINENAYTAASGYWAEVQNRLLQRIQLVGDSTAVRSFNPLSINRSIGHNPCNGVIGYTYEYNDRPLVCTPNAIQERISISDKKPEDLFASLIVLGRAAGPILQSIGTKTAPTRTLSIDIIIGPATGCPKDSESSNWLNQKPNVNLVVNALQLDLTDTYSQVFKQEDRESWKATQGNYSRTVTWTYLDCV